MSMSCVGIGHIRIYLMFMHCMHCMYVCMYVFDVYALYVYMQEYVCMYECIMYVCLSGWIYECLSDCKQSILSSPDRIFLFLCLTFLSINFPPGSFDFAFSLPYNNKYSYRYVSVCILVRISSFHGVHICMYYVYVFYVCICAHSVYIICMYVCMHVRILHEWNTITLFPFIS